MPLQFKASKAFWKQFDRLSSEQQESAREKFKTFKKNPFDPSLRPHKINRLTALIGQTVYAVEIAGDLRAAFYRDGDLIQSISIGTHNIYKA
jgi:hypothetical protein